MAQLQGGGGGVGLECGVRGDWTNIADLHRHASPI